MSKKRFIFVYNQYNIFIYVPNFNNIGMNAVVSTNIFVHLIYMIPLDKTKCKVYENGFGNNENVWIGICYSA